MEWVIWIGFGFLVVWVLSGIRYVPQGERWPVELFGRYCWTLTPGLKWYLPGTMRIRAKIDVRDQKIPLFESPIKIDFQDGSAIPKGAEAIVRVKSPDERYGPPG